MTEANSNNLEYISKVFVNLPADMKDYLLNIARSLMAIQDGNTHSKNSIPKEKEKKNQSL